MRGKLAAAAVVCSVACAGPALADCSTEVALAVQAQGKQKFLRKESYLISEQGPVKMTVDYQTPDRMRQIVTPLTEDKPVESIVVGENAWTNSGDGWRESPPLEAEQLVLYMIKSSSQIYQEVGKFECLGVETVEGRQLRAYRGLDDGPKDLSKDADKKPPKNEAVRMVYLDPDTGLPARSIFARPGVLDKPIFKEIYTYPTELKIEPPDDVKK
jgi:hypothetical protein